MEEEYSTEGLVCPYCGELHDAEATDYEIYEDLSSYCCHYCGNKFKVISLAPYSWWTSKS